VNIVHSNSELWSVATISVKMSSMRLKTTLHLNKWYLILCLILLPKNTIQSTKLTEVFYAFTVLCRDTCVHYNIYYTEKMWDDSLTFKLFQLKLDIILFLFLLFYSLSPSFYSFTLSLCYFSLTLFLICPWYISLHLIFQIGLPATRGSWRPENNTGRHMLKWAYDYRVQTLIVWQRRDGCRSEFKRSALVLSLPFFLFSVSLTLTHYFSPYLSIYFSPTLFSYPILTRLPSHFLSSTHNGK